MRRKYPNCPYCKDVELVNIFYQPGAFYGNSLWLNCPKCHHTIPVYPKSLKINYRKLRIIEKGAVTLVVCEKNGKNEAIDLGEPTKETLEKVINFMRGSNEKKM